MKKLKWSLFIVLSIILLITVSNVSALFDNGSFETGDFTSWTKETFSNPGLIGSAPFTSASIVRNTGGSDQTYVRYGVTPLSQSDGVVSAVKYPRYGNYAAVVNYNVSGTNANVLKQQAQVTSRDVDDADGKVHIRFAFAPVMEDPGHTPDEQPWFYIAVRNVTKGNTILYENFAYANQPGVPWQTSGSYKYTDWQVVDIAPGLTDLSIGDTIELEAIASACSLGGHRGWVYIDAFGSEIPGISVVATAPELVNPDSDLTYTYTYRNKGTADALNTIVETTIPANTSFVSVSDTTNCSENSGTVTCNFGTLTIDESGSFDMVVHVNSGATGTISHGAYSIIADSQPELLGPLVATTVTTDTLIDLSVTKTDGVTSISDGGTPTYTITVTNHSSIESATGVTVTDTLPTELTSVTWTCAGSGGGTCTASGSGNISDSIDLPASASVAYTLDATVNAGLSDSVINIVSITPPGDVIDANSNNNAALDANFIPAAPTLFMDENPPDGMIDVVYSYFVFAADGFPEPTYSVFSGSLPPGLTLGSNTGLLSGTPTTVGDYDFVIRATNSEGSVDTGTIRISITKPTTTTVLSTSSNPSSFGQNVTFTATVTSNVIGTGTPDGDIQFKIGGTNVGTPVTLNGSGVAQIVLDYNDLTIGGHNVTAEYSGSSSFETSSSNTVVQTVNKATPGISFTPDSSSVVSGESFDAVVTVSGSPSAIGTPTGTVNILVDGSLFAGPLTLDGSGEATVSNLSFDFGSHTVVVQYSGDATFSSLSPSFTNPVTVTKAIPVVTVTSSLNPSVYGDNVTFTVTVTAQAPSTATPSGEVQFKLNGTNYGSVKNLDGSGQATLLVPYTSIWPTTHDVDVDYAGSSEFEAGTGNLQQVVNKADPVISLTPNQTEVNSGETFSALVEVSANPSTLGTPTGTITLLVDSSPVAGPFTLDSSGQYNVTGLSLDNGSHTITVSYSGDDYFSTTPQDFIDPVTVSAADTEITSFSFTPDSVVVGQPVSVSVSLAVVSPGSGTPTGNVTISNGTDECTIVLANGSGSCNLTPTSTGQPDLTASYSGDSNLNGISGSVSGPNVSKANSEIVDFSFNPASVVFGQPVTMSVEIGPKAPASGTPTGTVTFSNGEDSCVVSLVAGVGSCDLTLSNPGQPDISVSYAGDTKFNSTSDIFSPGPTYAKADTTTVVVSSDNQSVYGQEIDFTATVSVDSPGTGTPTGFIQFYIDNVAFGEPVALISGLAQSSSIWDLDVSNYTVRAEYLGDSNYNTSVSGNITQEVIQVGTSLTLLTDPNPSRYGDTVTITATIVADSPSLAVPTGSVQFKLQNANYGSGVTVVNGEAVKVLQFTTLMVGTHNWTAVFTSNSPNFGSTDNLSTPYSHQILKAYASADVQASVNPSVFGQAVDFTVTVSHATNLIQPSGTVQVYLDGNPLGGALTLNGSGQATTPTINTLSVGDHTITVDYSGDDYYLEYSSVGDEAPFEFTNAHNVNKADASIHFDSIADMTLVVGEETTVTITVSAVLPGVGIPSGTVEISNGLGDTCEITLDGSGSGTCTFKPTTIASGDLTASYSGDTNFNEVVSDPVTGPTVSQAATTTSITAFDNGTIVVGEDTLVSVSVVSVAPGSGTPTGSVVISNENGDECTVTLSSGSGSCNLRPTSPTAADTGMTFTAVYQGDTNYQTSTSDSVTGAIVIKANTEILNLIFNPTNPVVGQITTVSLSVGVQSPGHGIPSGTVTISNGSEGCTITLNEGSGSCTYAPTTVTTPSAETITINYPGDSNFNPIVDDPAAGPIVSKSESIVIIEHYDPTSLYLGQPTLVDVSVSPKAPGNGLPTGTVTVTNGFDYCVVNLDGAAQGSCELTPSFIGQVNLQATYIGDIHFKSATSGQIPGPIVGKAPTITTITNISETALVVSQPVEVSVSVIIDPDPTPADLPESLMQMMLMDMPVLSGNVLVSNGTDECVAALTGGIGSCFLSPSAVGSPDFYATYQGDSNYAQSTSQAETGPTVTPASVSIVSMDFTPENPVVGQPVTVTVQAQVDAPGTGYPSGTIEVTNGTDSCVVTLDENGQGSCELIPSNSGNPDLEANFGGNSNYNPAPAVQEPGPVVTQANTSVTISGPTSAIVGSNLQWTATAAGIAPSEGTPEGTIQFYINGTAFGSPVTLVNGVAVSEQVSDLTVGNYPVTARYIETSAYAEGTSNILNLEILPDTYHVFIPMVIR
ncbi:MAG: hypothetical protein CL609_17910 [Anaerolineaceae bacterium]|nr:hypothetical protein [Anaerolineaceae bacterium]